MNSTKTKGAVRPPTPTGTQDRKDLLHRNKRATVPLRKTFVQAPRGSESRVGPLAEFVANGDLRGLRAYLIAIAATSKANGDGWTTTLDSLVWGRLMDADLTATPAAARTAAWRTFGRLEDRNLLIRRRPPGQPDKIMVTLLREDGSGDPYTLPANEEGPENWYLRIPKAFWTREFDSKLKMPGYAMLLALLGEKSWAAFPAERMPEWYGWSPDTTERGLKELLDLELAIRQERYKPAPLTAVGSTLFYMYRPARWLKPKAADRPAAPAEQTA